jgi:predicted amidohydrolase YtcJ
MDTVFVNGNVITMAVPNKREQALALDAGRIVKVGDSWAVHQLADANTRVVDLQGRTVLPGFIDSHMHCFLTGARLAGAQLESMTSVADVCASFRELARDAEPGKWLYGFGCVPWELAERRLPTMQELDLVAPRNPVYISAVTLHSGATNSRGFELVGLDPSHHGVETDHSGRPTGAFLSDDSHFHAAGVAFGALRDDEIADF